MGVKRRHDRLVLRVDPVLCDGYGHCAELAPDLVTLDEWGYPIIDVSVVPAQRAEALRSARLAVRGCPRHALRLERETD